MRKLITTLFAMLCLAPIANSQNITVAPATGMSPATFLNTYLMGGGVYIFNAKYNNSQSPITKENVGTFNANGFGGLYMANGVIMTTGNIDVAPGPNTQYGADNPIDGFYSDPEMAPIATGSINSCATFDFDFVTLSSNVSFNYTFASEEYPEYVCSQYNDVFAFFLTGPDPVTGEEVTRNIAIIPGTDTVYPPYGVAVAINSVNAGLHGSSGGDNGTGCYYDYSNYYVNNCNLDTNSYNGGLIGSPNYEDGIEYDGYTMKLSASAPILPCQVYHMHISVCNVGDNSYDSGVFLEGGSFNADVTAIGLGRTWVDTVKGSCPKEIPLSLGTTPFDEGHVSFNFGGTAVPGVDFDFVDEHGNNLLDTSLYIDNNVHSFIFRGRNGVDLSQDKTIEVYLNTSLCNDFPQLVTRDTMRFVFTRGGDVKLLDSTIRCNHVCFEVGTELVYGEYVSYRWEPTTGIDDPFSLTSSALIFESRDYNLIATGGTGCNSDTALVRVIIDNSNPDIPVGIEENELQSAKVYPNPAGEMIYIDAVQLQRIEVYSVEGRKVYDQAYQGVSGTVTVPTEGLANGVYGIRVSTANGTTGAKIVVNK